MSSDGQGQWRKMAGEQQYIFVKRTVASLLLQKVALTRQQTAMDFALSVEDKSV